MKSRHTFTRKHRFILVPKVLERFARHRWNGAQEVFALVALFAATKNLLTRCIPTWLGKQNAETVWGADRLAIHSGYSTGDVRQSRQQIAAIVTDAPLQEADPTVAMPAQPDPEFFQKMQNKTLGFAENNPGPIAIIACICNYRMNKGLLRKLFIAGERWQKANDIDTAQGKPRKYRICEIGSNAIEKETALGTLCRLCNEEEWLALPRKHWTLNNRSLATRALTRQVGAIVINMKIPQEQAPFIMFEGLTSTDARRKEISQLCNCLHCDFAAYWQQHYPNERYSERESMACLAAMAEDIRCESCRSECGHSFWQCVCRARSLQTNADSIQAVSASSLARQSRLIESPFKVSPAPKRLGRPPRLASVKKKGRTKNTGGATKNTRVHKPGKVNAWWGPWRIWCSDNKTKGNFGGDQWKGKNNEYHTIKGTPKFADLVRRGEARAHARLTCATYEQTPEPPFEVVQQDPIVALASGIAHKTVGEISATSIATISANVTCALAVCKGEPLPKVATRIRQTVRKINAEARKAANIAEAKHAEWLKERNATVQDEVVASASAVNGVTGVPSAPSITRVFWHVPAQDMAEKILSGAGLPRTTSLDDGSAYGLLWGSTHERLRSKWASRHKMYKHDKQPDQSKVKPNKYRSSLGRQLGFCVCGDATLDILLFRGAFLHILRGLFVKSATNLEKARMESNSIVLRLNWEDVDDLNAMDGQVDPDKAAVYFLFTILIRQNIATYKAR